MYENEIKNLNEFLRKELWMDFEMCSIGRGKIELHGFLDEADDDMVIITFESPYMVDCVFFFTYEGKGDFISIIDGEEAYRVNRKYDITKGNILFKLSNTNISTDMIIVAEKISIRIAGCES